MPVLRLKRFLEAAGVPYAIAGHPPVYTAQQTAEAAHLSGHLMAKTVIVKLDGRLAMAVLPADARIDLPSLASMTGAHQAALAQEAEFSALFPDVELGAMPPFGNLYGLPIYVSHELTENPRIAFNAGTHQEVIQMAYADFARLVTPTVIPFSTHEMLADK